jgi:hypothetical protein
MIQAIRLLGCAVVLSSIALVGAITMTHLGNKRSDALTVRYPSRSIQGAAWHTDVIVENRKAIWDNAQMAFLGVWNAPDSVTDHHLSARGRPADAVPSLRGVTAPRRPGGGPIERGGVNALRLPPGARPTGLAVLAGAVP